MKFNIETWAIKKLYFEYTNKKLNLNPPYQRNDIWTEKAQKDLIDTILNGLPVPNFFMHNRGNGLFDVADGQQRTRAILAYIHGEITNGSKVKFSTENSVFLDYEIAVIVIDEVVTEDEIRSFYVKVNNTGLRLNKPELTKAEYYSNKALTLVEELANLKSFKLLELFKVKQEARMVDREFVEELVAQLKYGVSDKKNGIERLYKEGDQIPQTEIDNLKKEFESIVAIIQKFDDRSPIVDSRYRQKNDFYTLFGFVQNNIKLHQNSLNLFYDILIKIGDDINPSNDKCEPLQDYAFNCVSQSNSKQARQERLNFFNALFLNKDKEPNMVQSSIMSYYELSINDVISVESFLTIDPKKIKFQPSAA